MVAENITRAGEMLAEAWKTKTRLSQLPDDDVPADRTEAYAIQDIMAERLGLTVAGWKLGMSAPGTMLQFDVTEPVPGRIFEECIYADGAEIPAGGYSGPKVEPEFAVRLKSALPARSEPYAREEIVMATDAVLMCLEIADNRVFMEAPVPLTMIADNGGFAAYVVGPEVEDWQSVDYVGVPVDLTIDGKVAAPGLTGEFRVDPIDVVLWTANNLSDRGHGLAAGDLISTGSATVPTPMNIGSEAVGRFEGLGDVRASFVA